MSQTKISPQYTVTDWIQLRPHLAGPYEAVAWEKAAAILKDRIENRFVKPVNILASYPGGAQAGFGFATLALDCLLIDTLQAFRLGRTRGHSARPTQEFTNFLKESPAFAAEFSSTRLRDDFVDSVRNGLLHDGETRKGWLVKQKSKDRKIIDKTEIGRILYRDDFHSAVEREFREYLRALADPDGDSILRSNYLRRMDSICGIQSNAESPLYFAYGSNMNAKQLTNRIGEVTRLGAARLAGYSIVFNKISSIDESGKANLAPDHENSSVWGILFRLTAEQLTRLSNFESGYFQTKVTVFQGSYSCSARTFIAKPDALHQSKPSYEYFYLISEGARELPSDYQTRLRAMCTGEEQP